jgi:hypothetical protein
VLVAVGVWLVASRGLMIRLSVSGMIVVVVLSRVG